MRETIFFMRIPLIRVFLFAIAVAVMGHHKNPISKDIFFAIKTFG